MKATEKLFKLMDKIAYVLTAICVSGMLFCVFLQVVARLTRLTVNWTTEMSQYFFLWSTTFASYIAARRGKLLGVELVQKSMPSFVSRIMRFASWICAAIFYGLVVYYTIPQLSKLMRQTTPILKWPMGMIYIIMLAGLVMLLVYFAWLAIAALFFDEKEKSDSPKTAEQIAEEVE